MDSKRRQFIQGLLGTTGAMTLFDLVSIAKANTIIPPKTDRHFVFAYFTGGWDAILTVDPKDPLFYDDTESTIAEYGVQTGYGILGHTEDPRLFNDSNDLILGPYIGDMVNFADRISVVRGMTVSSVAHETALLHMHTGKPPAGFAPRSSSIATILTELLGEDDLIPNLVSGSPSYNLDRPAWCSALGASNLNELQDLLSPGISNLGQGERDALDQFFSREEERMKTPRMQSIFENRQTSRQLIEENVADLFNAQSNTVEPLIEKLGNNATLMAYLALTNGFSRCVSFNAIPFSDAHFGAYWKNIHRYYLQTGFNRVAALAAELEATPYPTGGSWLDHTTIVCMSEFNRSPTLNETGGRDHATTNSCLLLGGDIVGGRTIGATHEYNMAGQSVDLLTGAVSEAGENISHEHIATTLIKSLGVEEDVGDFRVQPIDALLV